MEHRGEARVPFGGVPQYHARLADHLLHRRGLCEEAEPEVWSPHRRGHYLRNPLQRNLLCSKGNVTCRLPRIPVSARRFLESDHSTYIHPQGLQPQDPLVLPELRQHRHHWSPDHSCDLCALCPRWMVYQQELQPLHDTLQLRFTPRSRG